MKIAKSSKLLKRVRRVQTTPDNAVRKLLKNKPRGVPFPKGNNLGRQFKKGESGNPKGRPATALYSVALRALLALKPTDPLPSRTNAQKLAKTAFELAVKKKNLGAICEVGDRTEGRVGVATPGNGEESPLMILIHSMHARSDAIGAPENSTHQLKGASDATEES